MLQCMSPVVAHRTRPATSAFPTLLKHERTNRGHRRTDAIDPIANMKLVAIDERNAMERRLGQVGRSVYLQPERFDDRRPESNIGCERLPEFFRV
jgi:hypothetical protein